MKVSVAEVSVTPLMARSDTVPGLFTGAVTVSVAVPLLPSLVAVMVAVPAATPVPSPLPFTVATAGALVVQVTTRPVSALPLASLGVAVSCTVCPAGTPAVAGLTATDATGTVLTVMAAGALCPSLVAVIVAVPAATPVTSPLPVTVATAGALVAHVTTRPLSGWPFASLGVAVNCTVCPTVTLAVAGLSVTDATGALLTTTVAVPLCPSLVAVSVAAPVAMPVATPLPLTAATVRLLVVQVTERPVRTLPVASLRTVLSCWMLPTVRLSDGGAIATDATGAGDFGATKTESGFSHAASAAVESSTAPSRIRAKRWDNLNVKGMTSPKRKRAASFDSRSMRWRPGGRSDGRRFSPVALRHHLSAVLL